MSFEANLSLCSLSSSPSCLDGTGQRILSSRNAVLCHPTEDDEDFTVSDAMRRQPQSTAIERVVFDELDQADALRNDYEPHRVVREVVQRLHFPTDEGLSVPATHLGGISAVEQDMPRNLTSSGCVSSIIDLHSNRSDQLSKTDDSDMKSNCQVFHDGPKRRDHRIGPQGNPPNIGKADVEAITDDLCLPVHAMDAPDCNDISILRRNYWKLLEKHQQFIVSNVQLREHNESLENRNKQAAQELERAEEELEQERHLRLQLSNQVDSLQRSLAILKEKIPKLATPDHAATDNGSNEQGEWTSSLKEELGQTMILVITQQQELNELYEIVKEQNKAIRRLSQLGSHSGKDQKTWDLRLNEREVSPKELEFRQKPDGSSDLVALDERPRTSPPRSAKNPSRGTSSSKNVPKKLPNEHNDTTVSDIVKFPDPSPTVTKSREQAHESSGRRMPTGAITSLTRYPKKASEHPIDCGFADVDPENSDFVFVDPSHVEIRICPLCNADFFNGKTTVDEFVDHVSSCNPLDNSRQCPVCDLKFNEKLTDRQIQMHVNEHFDEDRFQPLYPTDANC